MSYSDNPFIPQMLSPTSYEIGRYGRTPTSHFYAVQYSGSASATHYRQQKYNR